MALQRQSPKRPLVLAGAAGGALDRIRGLRDLAQIPEIDVIVGDWMSEANMTVRGAERAALKAQSQLPNGVSHETETPNLYLSNNKDGYDPYFLEQLEPALPHLARNKTKLACNAGGSNPGGLALAVQKVIAKLGLDLKVAWVEGDDVSDATFELLRRGERLANLPTGQDLKDWEFEPICAQCYLGGTGVAKAFAAGADIIICGRISDASACVGACMWWHGWNREDNIQELSGALIAGHCTECSTYATGGCYAGFKEFDKKYTDLAFPIAYIDSDGTFELTMEEGKEGQVSIGTVTSQLIYEIQGPLYYNSDVTANIEGIKLETVGENRVRVSGVQGHPPPPTTKVGITAKGGYRGEFHYYLTGLDIQEKAEMIELQVKAMMGDNLEKFHFLNFTVAGTVPEDPATQDKATVDLRIFAQTRYPELLSSSTNAFLAWCKSIILQSYPGGTPSLDVRTGIGKPYFEYWVTLIPQAVVEERVHLPDGTSHVMPPPTLTKEYPRQQPSYDTDNPLPPNSWGPTTRAPLGYIVLGRSGDKSSDANMGLFVRYEDEWDWLRSTLSIATLKQLLGRDYVGKKIDRFEIPGARAVHFLLWDHLDRGYNACGKFDTLGKNLVEFIRAKHVQIPKRFLDRGRV